MKPGGDADSHGVDLPFLKFARLAMSFSHGAEWKTLISKYIASIPAIGDASIPQIVRMAFPLPTCTSTAKVANVGVARMPSHRAT
jgi:hypothetical protein